MARKRDYVWDGASGTHLWETNAESLCQTQSKAKMHAGNRELSK